MMRRALTMAVVGVLGFAAQADAATYYVRTDGGTASECTGLADAAYPGSGTGQNCAWSHPFWALDGSGAWRIQGGDTLVIGPGSYMMGWGAPNTSGWCDATGAFICHLPPLPSGPSAANPTRLVGKGWDAGCGTRPELWGTERADTVLNLDGSSNAMVACLEITDHESCVEFHSTPSAECERNNPPYGDWASNGIYAADAGSVVLRDLDVHGLGSYGVLSGRLSDWMVDRVRLAGNGWGGWNGDLGGNSANSGTLVFRNFTVEWNGCGETWPGGQPDHCWAQQAGGYGDGIGTGATGGDWVFEDSFFGYNTSDGLDMLYIGNGGLGGSVEVRRTVSTSNAGDQMKVGGQATVVNSLMVSHCSFFENKSFAQEMTAGDHCRAGGSALAVELEPGAEGWLVNSTLVGEGDCLVIAECPSCTGGEQFTLMNNVLRAYTDWYQPWENACFIWDPNGVTVGNNDYNLVYEAKDGPGYCAAGANNMCTQDPLFVLDVLNNFDGHLQPASPAIDSGLPVGGVGGLVPSVDLEGGTRPAGSGVDRGAYEYGSVSSSMNHLSGMGLGLPNENRVRIHRSAGGTAAVDFLAYGAGQWGVNVASGNLDGSTYDQIVTGPGPGAVFGPQVRGFLRDATAMQKVNYYAYGTLKFGVNAVTGELDGDGYDEILSGAGPGEVFGPHIRGWNYDGAGISSIAKINIFTYGTLKFGVNPASGDVDADGYAEIVSGAGPGVVFGAQVRGFDYDGIGVSAIAGINFLAYSLQYGVNVAGADADGDGYAEIATAPGPGAGAGYTSWFKGFDVDASTVTPLNGFDVTPFGTLYGGRVGLHDMQSSGGADLLAGAGRDPAADATVISYDYDGSSLTVIGSFAPFANGTYGVNPTGGNLGY